MPKRSSLWFAMEPLFQAAHTWYKYCSNILGDFIAFTSGEC